MLSSLYSGISGLLTNSESINVIGNNIANVNTVGFKSQRTSFQDMLYQSIESASGTSQVGRGAILASIDTSFAQGSFETTSSATDLAIGGEGFFMVKGASDSTVYYTRAGNFSFDSDGNLTNSAGLVLQGRVWDQVTAAPSGVDVDINVSSGLSQPKATAGIGMAVNLQSTAAWKGTITQPTAGFITNVAASSGKYPLTGNWSTVTTTQAGTGTGTNGPTIPAGGMAGNLIITGTVSATINLATANAGGPVTTNAELATAINDQTATTGVTATITAGGKLQLTGPAGKDVVVNDTGVTTGSIGWTATDKTATSLYGFTMTMSNPTGTSYTGSISAIGGTMTNWAGSGYDLTTTGAVASSVPAFSVEGFNVASANTTSDYSSSVTVYDSMGQAHVVNVYFRKSYETTTPQTAVWEWHAVIGASDANVTPQVDTEIGSGTLTFNSSGVLTAGGDPVTLVANFTGGATQSQPIRLTLGSASGGGTSTQYPIASTTNFQSQDGYAPGTLTSLSVDSEGILSGHYSNGQILNLYQVTLASFANEQGLTRAGGNLFVETQASGVSYKNTPGDGGLGNINSNSLEQSNVDLATEFVKMIVAQRGYQASSKVITTTDEMLQELMQLKR